MGDWGEGVAFIPMPFYTDKVRLASGLRIEVDYGLKLGCNNFEMPYVQSSCLKTSSKKGTPATMPVLFPNNDASAMVSPTTNPP